MPALSTGQRIQKSGNRNCTSEISLTSTTLHLACCSFPELKKKHKHNNKGSDGQVIVLSKSLSITILSKQSTYSRILSRESEGQETLLP